VYILKLLILTCFASPVCLFCFFGGLGCGRFFTDTGAPGAVKFGFVRARSADAFRRADDLVPLLHAVQCA
jgi:hypothetical protein